jgi:glucokinase
MIPPLLLGIEIGGTKLQLGLGRGDGRILGLERRTIRPEAGAEGILRQIAEAYPVLLGHHSTSVEIPSAVGIGFGGPVDAHRGVILKSHQVWGWDGFDLAGWVRLNLGLSLVTIENDADTAGLGEALNGSGVGLSPIFYVTIGSGIGGGLILDGQIYRGSGRGAAEIGQLWIDGLDVTPRKLEDLASGWSIGAIARSLLSNGEVIGPLDEAAQGDRSKVDAAAVARAAAEGDSRAIGVLSTATRAIGMGLAHVVTLLAPRRIILGGGVSLIGDDLWFNPIRSALDARVFPPFRGTFDLVPSQLGEEVVVQGALALARTILEESGA